DALPISCQAIVHAAATYSGPAIINISSGTTVTIAELVSTIARLVGSAGRIRWDTTKPEGQLYKGFDVTRMKTWLGFECETSLEAGLRLTIDWFVENRSRARLQTAL